MFVPNHFSLITDKDYRQYEANLLLEARLDELRKHYDIYVKDQPWIDGEKLPG